MTTQNTSQQIDWVAAVNALVTGVSDALFTAMVTTSRDLAPACEVAGEEIEAETEDGRALIVFDELQRDVLTTVFAAAPNVVELRAYLDYLLGEELAARAKQQPAPAAVVKLMAVLPPAPALADDGFRVHWNVHPDVYFANQMQTL